MAVELRWLGHGSWSIQTGEFQILLDPFLNDSPTAPCKANEVSASHILVSHGHFDHTADVAEIAHRCDSQVIAIFEVAQWFQEKQNVKATLGMNLGGAAELPFGKVKCVPALHSSSLPDGTYGGMPAGFVLEIESKRIYFACDTALFSDMELIGRGGLDLAVLPIGDLFTMGLADSIEAIKLLRPKQVLPAHYNTWPPIAQDGKAWAEMVNALTEAEPIVLSPGESHSLA